MSAKILELHAIVKGDVQGVGFRFTTQQLANSMNIRGSVRNLPDGSVEIFALASQKFLEQFLTELSETFPQKIAEMEVKYTEANNIPPDFTIRS